MDRPINLAFNLAMLALAISGGIYGAGFMYPTNVYMAGVFGLLGLSAAANTVLLLRRRPAADETASRLVVSRDAVKALGLILAYATLIPVVGFYATSLMYFFISVLLFSARQTRRELPVALAVSVSMIALVYFMFSYLLRVPAPQGLLF